MKSIIIAILAFSSTASLAAKAPKKKATEKQICQQLWDQAEANCTEQLCEPFETQGEKCPDEDFAEALQGCMDGELSDLIVDYDKKNGTSLQCE